MKQLLTALNTVSKSVLRRKVAFEDATDISTPRLTLNLKSFWPSDASGEVSSAFANFILPSGREMFHEGREGLGAVNQKVRLDDVIRLLNSLGVCDTEARGHLK